MFDMATPSTSDIFQVACQLRAEDYEECLASGFPEPVRAVAWSVEKSDESLTVFLEGEPVGVWGYRDNGDGSCVVWAVGTDRLSSKPILLHKISRALRDVLLEDYSSIRNRIYTHNKGHMRWLQSLGAVFSETEDPLFLEFEIKRT